MFLNRRTHEVVSVRCELQQSIGQLRQRLAFGLKFPCAHLMILFHGKVLCILRDIVLWQYPNILTDHITLCPQ